MAPIGFDEIAEGQAFTSTRRTITEADIMAFAGVSGDFNPLHVDAVFAARETPFGRRIAHGLLGVAIGSGLRSGLDDWHLLAFLETRRRFEAPMFAGDTIHVEATVASTRRSASKPDRGVVVIAMRLVNQDGAVVQSGEDTVLVGTPDAEEGDQ